MTAFALHSHPLTPCAFIDAVAVAIQTLPHSAMRYVYEVRGDIRQLDIPGARLPVRTNDLWRQTCFEAFLREPGTSVYDEFNFAPSGEWAAYRFEHYRSGMVELELGSMPAIACHQSHDLLRVEVLVGSSECTAPALQLGLSAVLRDRTGTISYWALRHAPGKPDFHHDHAFVGRIDIA